MSVDAIDSPEPFLLFLRSFFFVVAPSFFLYKTLILDSTDQLLGHLLQHYLKRVLHKYIYRKNENDSSIMGRDNNNRRNRGGRGNKYNSKKKKSNKDSSKSSTSTKRKTLADHIFYVGSAKQASDFVTVNNYIINHIRRTFDKGNDIATALEEEKEIDLSKYAPQLKVSTEQDSAKKAIQDKQFEKQFEIEYITYNERKVKYEENRSAAAATLWNQCASSMKTKLQSRPDYDEIKGDPVKLLLAIKQHTLSYESTQFRMKTICDSMKSWINTKQREDALTNILSLAQTTDKYRVTFDSAKDNAFYVHTPKKTVRFGRTKANLYAHTPTRMATSKPEVTPLGPKTFVQTVEENMKFHTPREIKRAKLARDLIAALGSPSVADLKAAIAMNAIANLPVTTKDVDIAEKIFGPDLGTIKGKTTRRKPLPMVTDQIAIPPQLYEKRDALDLCIDIMFVNEMPFLTSITKALFYRMALFLPTQTARDLYAALDNVFRLYNSNGFSIAKIFCDNQFQTIMDPIQDDLDVTMVYSAAQAHEPVSERNNRVIKERVRAAFHRLPYKALPKAIMKALVIESARKLNYFPAKHGISQHYSPRQIVHQTTLNYEHECKYAIGTYVQAHDEPNPTNTQAPRSLDAIYIRATDNGHDVYDLSTQKIINRRRLTAMPITPTVIKAVEDIADAEKQKGLRIKTKKGRTLYDSSWTAGVDYDEEEEDDEDEDSDYEYDSDDSQCSTTDKETDTDSDSDDDEHSIDSEEEQSILYEPKTTGVRQRDPVQEQPQQEQEDERSQVSAEPTRRSTRVRSQPNMLRPSMRGQTYDSKPLHQHLIINEDEATEYTNETAKYMVSLMQAIKE